jgi:hypothetical protein
MALWRAKRGSGRVVGRTELVEENLPVQRLIRLGVGNVLGFHCVTLMSFWHTRKFQYLRPTQGGTVVGHRTTRRTVSGIKLTAKQSARLADSDESLYAVQSWAQKILLPEGWFTASDP